MFLLKNILQHVLYWCEKFQVDGIKFEIMVSKIAKNLNFEKSGIDDYVGRRKNWLKNAALPSQKRENFRSPFIQRSVILALKVS